MNYGYGPSSSPVAITNRCEVNEDDQYCEDERGDNESDGDGDVQAYGHILSLLTLNQLIDNDQGRYVCSKLGCLK